MSDASLLEDIESALDADAVWAVIIWDDPVNTMDYVSKALQKEFGYSKSRAEALMMGAHREGKAAVWSGQRDEAEKHCVSLHGWGIQTTVTKQ